MTKPVLAGRPRGRQKGSKNKKTIANQSTALAIAGVAALCLPPVPAKVRLKAQAGISSKDVMLASMRDYWAACHALEHEAHDVQAQAELLPEIPPDPETGKLSARDLLLAKAGHLRRAAEAQKIAAIDAAARVAPYEHAKLANVDQRVIGHITVDLKRF